MTTSENSTSLLPIKGDVKSIDVHSMKTPGKRFVLRNASVISEKHIEFSIVMMHESANERPNTNNQNW